MTHLIPLAERLRPKNINEYVGQQHLIEKGAILRQAIEHKHIPSIIFWGPPGVGKTTLAYIIANELDCSFFNLSAISAGVKEIRDIIERAKKLKELDNPVPILFIDEIHRFSKSQQDSLLGAIEQGLFTLIGATTENPSFEIISALLSRCQVYILKPLTELELVHLLKTAIQKDVVLNQMDIDLKEHQAIVRLSGGDARKLLNALELLTQTVHKEKLVITNSMVVEQLQQNIVLYDKAGDQHYDLISAFIKSIRGSDPNAAVYWLARIIAGGESPLFIARRLLILAAEDIGNANPNALLLANSCFQAVHAVGWPESRIILSQTAIYLASSVKSNASYEAINRAQAIVAQTGDQPVPLHLRNAPTKLMKEIGYGSNYQYAHAYEKNFVDQEYFPNDLSGTILYEPGKNTSEEKIRERLRMLWKNKYTY